MSFLLRAWELAGQAGGTIALVFIVAVAAGLGLLALLYLASALVVLERFARVSRSWLWTAANPCLFSIIWKNCGGTS